MKSLFLTLALSISTSIFPAPTADLSNPNIEIRYGTVTRYQTYAEYDVGCTQITFDDGTGWVLDGIVFEHGDLVKLTINNKGTEDISDNTLLRIEKIK